MTKKYATMSGRAARAEFWWFQLFILVTDICLIILADAVGRDYEAIPLWTCLIFTVVTFIPYWCVFVRRLHDRGHSGSLLWFALLSLAIIFSICLIINMFGSDKGRNEYGPNPNEPDDNNDNVKDSVLDSTNDTSEKEEIVDVNL